MGATDARAALALALFGAAATATAAARASATVAVYADDDQVTVISPSARAGAAVGPVELSASGGLDVVSAASVDVRSSASPRGFSEVRGHLEAEGRWAPAPGLSVTPGYGVSLESDFMTHLFSLALSRDVLDRSATLGVGYAFGWSRVTRAHDAETVAYRRTHQAEASWSQVLNAEAALDLSYGLSVVNGFQANLYRYVRLYADGQELHGTAVAERTPEWRLRHTGTVRLRARLLPEVFAQAEYSLYADSWGMGAHSAAARGSYTFASWWTVSFEARAHSQSGVSFYRGRYQTLPLAPALRTAEKELGPLWSVLGGLHLDFSPPVRWAEQLKVGAGAECLHLRYLDHPSLTRRTALMVMLELSWVH